MTNLDILCIILLLVLCIELVKCHNTIEGFASSPTENRLSNSDENSPSDRFANDGEEVLIMTQEPSGMRKIEFSNIRTRLNKSVVIIVRSNKTGSVEQISNFAPIQIKQVNYKTINLLGQNNFLISDGSTLRYYIKFLSQGAIHEETKKTNEINTKKENYELCLKVNAGAPRNQAAERCAKYL